MTLQRQRAAEGEEEGDLHACWQSAGPAVPAQLPGTPHLDAGRAGPLTIVGCLAGPAPVDEDRVWQHQSVYIRVAAGGRVGAGFLRPRRDLGCSAAAALRLELAAPHTTLSLGTVTQEARKFHTCLA